MIKNYTLKRAFLTSFLLFCFTCMSNIVLASDHGEGHIGDFYVFKRSEKLVMVMTIVSDLPFDINKFQFSADFTYRFLIDKNASVIPIDKETPPLYGPQILNPAEIKEDIIIAISFDENGKVKKVISGLTVAKNSDIKVFAGVKDDPFIRDAVEGKNIAAIVVEFPLAYVLEDTDNTTILSWATTTMNSNGVQHDHGGNPYRSQKIRKLNSLHPNKHHTIGEFPDVLVFNASQDANYPNGRDISDDVVGDLPGHVVKRRTMRRITNDVDFLDVFPYLAEPHIYEVGKLPGPHHKDIYNAPLAVFDLAEIGLPGRKARIRYWIMNPGGIIGHHWHDSRPAFVYLTEGTVIETKCTKAPNRPRSAECPEKVTTDTLRGPIEVKEPEGIQHWWINQTSEMVKMVAIDLPPQKDNDGDGIIDRDLDTPVDFTQIDYAPISAPNNTDGVNVRLLGEHDMLKQFPGTRSVQGYFLRGRIIKIPPGKSSSMESSLFKPTFAYFLNGDAFEVRDDRKETIKRAGDLTIIKGDVSYYWQNKTVEEVEILVFDFDKKKHGK